MVGYKGKFTYDVSKPVGMKRKVVNVSKLTAWGWKSQTSLCDGLVKTYDFYLKYFTEDN